MAGAQAAVFILAQAQGSEVGGGSWGCGHERRGVRWRSRQPV